jgi:hypothetical protein
VLAIKRKDNNGNFIKKNVAITLEDLKEYINIR